MLQTQLLKKGFFEGERIKIFKKVDTKFYMNKIIARYAHSFLKIRDYSKS